MATLGLMDGLVDIYMPDFRFWMPEAAAAACNAGLHRLDERAPEPL